MINWDNFYVFAAVSICLWLAGAVFALRSSSKSKVAIVFTSGRHYYIGNIYCRIMDIPPAPSITHYGRNPIVVFILYGNSRIANLYQMEVSLDSLFLDVTFYSFCDH